MNINEDLQRDEISAAVKGVLFRNGYRIVHLDKRDVQFTEKCIISAKSSCTALVTTSDLYGAAQYLSSNADPEYAVLCRKAMLEGAEIVTLPTPPEGKTNQDTSV